MQLDEEIENKLAQQRAMEEGARRQRIREYLETQTPEEKENLLQSAMSFLLQEQEAQEEVDLEDLAEQAQDTLLDQGIQWLNEKWGHEIQCPYCGNQSWEISGPFSIPVGEGQTFLSPVFQVMCSNCGQTTHVNAIRAGAVEEDPDRGGNV